MFAGSIAGRTQTLPLVVYGEFQVSLEASVAAASVLLVAALSVLVAVRLTHWRSAMDVRLAA
jgi:ABC-type sulfate transport system permease component